MNKTTPHQQVLAINNVRTNGGTQSRVALDEGHIAELASWLSDHPGEDLPNIKVAEDPEGNLWLFDGFHRVPAYSRAGRSAIPADVHPGSQRDAVLWSLAQNAAHGLKRSNLDKRKAVKTMLADPEWSRYSDGQIAKACAVSRPFVTEVRKARGGNVSRSSSLCAEGQDSQQGEPEKCLRAYPNNPAML